MSKPFVGNFPVTQKFLAHNAVLTGGIHKGIDWGVPAGTPILSAQSGIVHSVGNSPSAGLFVVISSGAFVHRYFHLNSYDVRAGQHVQAGQKIGSSGSTGLSTGPHLHFQVEKNGVLFDPLIFIGLPEKSSTPNNVVAPNVAVHTIRAGDTFWDLELAFGLTHGTLQQLNPGVDPRNLQIGQNIKIKVDKPKNSTPVTQHYIIKSGDTFWALERAWGMKTGSLQALNPKLDPRKLRIGQRIRKS